MLTNATTDGLTSAHLIGPKRRDCRFHRCASNAFNSSNLIDFPHFFSALMFAVCCVVPFLIDIVPQFHGSPRNQMKMTID